MTSIPDVPEKQIPADAPPVKLKDRLVSIDTLRGFAMFLLIAQGDIGGAHILPAFFKLCNFTRAAASQFNYALWEGLNIVYIASPLFLFVSGLTIPISLSKRLGQGQRDAKFYIHVIKRVLVLYLLGLIAGGHLFSLEFAHMQIYNNVLQYIGIGYLVCTILVINTSVRTQFVLVVVLLSLYWMLFLFIPVPGWHGDHFSKQMNLAIYIDNMVMGPFHRAGSCQLLRTINFISNMLLGVLLGQLLNSNRDKKDKTILLFASGLIMLSAGFIWGQFFPIIRHLWTSSYVLVTCGISALLLALFYFIIDVRGHSKWAFFLVVFGVNSIAVYMMTHMFDFKLIGNIFVGGLSRFLAVKVQAFVEAIAAMTVIWLIMYWMYRKKTFIKV
ncbi:MAG: DUF5009 domain-containing protein [Kiritimatiellae bacterium]|nr:DUF5009 domain-containing protein [Kiritimatiellia bacterium]MDD5522087.1 DUF5009 domain-containing protein [Kiritimatiellia bacterium]